MIHLRYDLRPKDGSEAPRRHPQTVMKDLGIKYQIHVPQSMADQWWFFNCENVPNPLPNYLTVFDSKPEDCIGYGLSKEDVQAIKEYATKNATKISINERDCNVCGKSKWLGNTSILDPYIDRDDCKCDSTNFDLDAVRRKIKETEISMKKQSRKRKLFRILCFFIGHKWKVKPYPRWWIEAEGEEQYRCERCNKFKIMKRENK